MKHPEVLKIKNLKMMVYILIHSSIALTMNFLRLKIWVLLLKS